jgi:hypothetical protein
MIEKSNLKKELITMSIVLTGFPTASDKTTIYTDLLHYTSFFG